MLKNILKLKGTQILNKNEQKTLSGGMFPVGQGSCQDLFVSADCCDPRWTTVCGFTPGPCVNGSCLL